MATTDNALIQGARLPDPAELAAAWTRIFTSGQDVLRATAERHTAAPVPAPFDPQAPARAIGAFAANLLADPLKLFETQRSLIDDWIRLWTTSASRAYGQQEPPVITPERGDRRFNAPEWGDQPIFDYLKQAYLLTTRQTLDIVRESDLDPATRTRVDFYARQFLNAISPANFAFTNPEALKRALETGGVSLLSGLANMLSDAASPSGLVRRRSHDDFELGVTLAATPGSVIYQNEMMQLIQYAPTTAEVYKRPLLYVPPLVNKFYILDLQPKSSMIKWLVDQGHSVFVISWVNPGADLGERGIADYIRQGPVSALDAIEQATGERVVDAFGFCMGGTLLAIAAAYLAATGEADRIASLTMIGTLLDFSETGEWATFYESGHMEAFERHVQATGVIGADKLQALFSLVRSNDLIWSSVVNHYLLDRTAPASDLLFWFADGARIPQGFLVEYGRELLLANRLREPGGLIVGGVPIDLAKVTIPTKLVSLKDDHVAGWQATYEGAKLFGGPTGFLLGGSGHNAGLVNPPAAGKHGYWTNNALPASAEDWFGGAAKQDGSWWPAWQRWLADAHGEMVAARTPGAGGLPAIEPAPGSYVRAA